MYNVKKMQQLGRLMRQIRKKQRLTQQQLAAVSGVGVRFIREMEQGKESCYIGKVLIVAAMLGLEIFVNGPDMDVLGGDGAGSGSGGNGDGL